jgi:hypothetical protein
MERIVQEFYPKILRWTGTLKRHSQILSISATHAALLWLSAWFVLMLVLVTMFLFAMCFTICNKCVVLYRSMSNKACVLHRVEQQPHSDKAGMCLVQSALW